MNMQIFNSKQREKLFPIFKKYVYLNTASTGIIPESSIQQMTNFLRRYRGEGIHHDAQSFKMMDDLREKVGNILGTSPERIAIGFNTSFGINISANGLHISSGKKIVLAPDEFPANFYPWKTVAERRNNPLEIISQPDEDLFDIPDTGIIAVSWVRFFDGFRFDLNKLGKIARKNSAFLCIDGIQGAGVLSPKLDNSTVDTFSAGGQKWLLSPYGTGIFYVNENTPLEPTFVGWLQRFALSGDYSSLRKYDLPMPKNAIKFEMGTMPYHNLWAMWNSVSLLDDIGIENIENYTTTLTEEFVLRLKDIPDVQIISPSGKRRSSIVSIAVSPARTVFEKLKQHRIIPAFREGKLRFSFHIYNNIEDIDRTIDILKRVIK